MCTCAAQPMTRWSRVRSSAGKGGSVLPYPSSNEALSWALLTLHRSAASCSKVTPGRLKVAWSMMRDVDLWGWELSFTTGLTSSTAAYVRARRLVCGVRKGAACEFGRRCWLRRLAAGPHDFNWQENADCMM